MATEVTIFARCALSLLNAAAEKKSGARATSSG